MKGNGLIIYGLSINSYVDQYIDLICNDFMNVVDVMKKKKLITGQNVSRYNYYIIRLCGRRGMPYKGHGGFKNKEDV